MQVTEVLSADFLTAEKKLQAVVFRGACTHWPAYQLWRGESGLQRLSDLCGAAAVEVMCSSDGNFHGAIAGRQLETCQFADFLSDRSEHEQLYLAQNPIWNGDGQPCPLQALHADIEPPLLPQERKLSSINLWMSKRSSRSSLHYDPFQNLLHVVTGSKQVKLFSPAATALLYPLPLWGESSNHSAVDFTQPDLEKHSDIERAKEYMGIVSLQAGDAIFLPEGYWHQVDSAPGTIAVNFWWQSTIACVLEEDYSPYLLRRSLQSALHVKKEQMLANIVPMPVTDRIQGLSPHTDSRPLWEQSAAGLNLLVQCPPPGECGCYSREEPQTNRACMNMQEECLYMLEECAASPTGSEGSTDSSEELGSLRMAQLDALTCQHKDFCDLARDAEQLGDSWNPETARLIAYWSRISSFDIDSVASACGRCWDSLTEEHITFMRAHEPFLRLGVTLLKGSKSQKGEEYDHLGLRSDDTTLLAALSAWEVTDLMLFLVRHFPRCVNGMLSGRLNAAAAEMLTRRFEEADAKCRNTWVQEARQVFYARLYSTVDDKSEVMRFLITCKEELSKAAARMVIQEQVGELNDDVAYRRRN